MGYISCCTEYPFHLFFFSIPGGDKDSNFLAETTGIGDAYQRVVFV